MQRILLFFLLAAVHFSAKAQHYQSIFGKQSTSWEIAWYNLFGTSQSTITVQKDTLVNNLAYKKVIANHFSYGGGLLREDTIAGKVWYKKLYPEDPQFPFDTTEVLLFDYNLSVGDTFNISGIYKGYGYGLPGGPIGSYPDSFNVVKRVFYQNNLKHIEFKGPNLEAFTMIEGIGGTFGVIWKEYSGGMTNQYLLCSYKDGLKTSFINKVFQGSCLLTGIPEYRPEEKITVYPNPSQNWISFNIPKPIIVRNLILRNAVGRLVLEVAPFKEAGLNISKLPPGLYFLQMELSGNGYFYQTFIKQP